MQQVTPRATACAAPCALGPGRQRGFTIIELMIAMVVLGILLAVALPNFQSTMRKSRRTEAFAALSNIQQAQERHRSTQTAYTDLITAAPPTGLALPATTSSGYYGLVITLVGGGTTTYVATATAVAGTSQAADGPCSVLAVRIEGGNIRYGSGTPPDWTAANPDPLRCWAR
jgi:type IV pilus assembly protein PilE